MKRRLKKILPDPFIWLLRSIKITLELIFMYSVDMIRFNRTLAIYNRRYSQQKLRAVMTYYYHVIEKGLSHPNTRPGFGKEALDNLYKALEDYKNSGYSLDDARYKTSISVIQSYISYHESIKFDVHDIMVRFSKFLDQESETIGGVDLIERKNINYDGKNAGFDDLARRRRSVRAFSDRPVDTKLIEEAIAIAMKTPSACNRQPWKVYVIKNKEIQKQVLEYQRGFRGYENSIDTLLMVAVDNRCMLSARERNQGFIDGGLFAMSLLYALEYVGLAACPLNAALSYKSDKRIRRILSIPAYENIIMFVAAGNFPERYKVPKSHRDNYKDICKYVQ
jgi:nitroreductase